MLFNSLSFLIFFPVVVMLYFTLPKKLKNYWLLAASYYFYMCWNAKYALLILFSTVVTYASGLLMARAEAGSMQPKQKQNRKKWVVAASFVLNLAILFFYKYFNFAMDGLQKVLGAAGIALHMPTFDVLLPVGISFYSFQALSYTMDVYRGEIKAEKNFFQYALFVSFFPQLVAGPIERSKNLLEQLEEPKKFQFERARDGLLLMLWGFFLKIVLADRIAIFVDTVYGQYTQFTGWYLTVATVLFAFQIYCDFMGYSVIAMGASQILGIQLMENFRAPYLNTSVASFWRDWHISLTSWFRDYLYIPLGGSRKGKLRKQLNKMIVFLVSGLWHGAQYSYVAWGLLNGLYQVAGELLKPLRDRLVRLFGLNRNSLGHKLLCGLVTFALIDLSWIFFRAEGIGEALIILKSIVKADNPWVLVDGSLYGCGLDRANFMLMLICLAVLLFADLCKRKGIKIRKVITDQDAWVRWLVFAGATLAILLFGKYGPGYEAANFIYFQF
ncbi:MAG: MBOAT family protein [Clostridia bacterium]|nr:MBOAT family protein [Clostridia bacterium]